MSAASGGVAGSPFDADAASVAAARHAAAAERWGRAASPALHDAPRMPRAARPRSAYGPGGPGTAGGSMGYAGVSAIDASIDPRTGKKKEEKGLLASMLSNLGGGGG